MAKFIFKLDNKEIDFETLPPGPVKELFQKLKKTIAKQLQSLKCEIHHNEPVIVLQASGSRVTLAGYGACCVDFISVINKHIKLPECNLSTDFVITTKHLKYTQHA